MRRWIDLFISARRLRKDEERRRADRVHVPNCPRCQSWRDVYVLGRGLGIVYFVCRSCQEHIVISTDTL